MDVGSEVVLGAGATSRFPFVPEAVRRQLFRSESIAQAGPVIQKELVPYDSPFHSFRYPGSSFASFGKTPGNVKVSMSFGKLETPSISMSEH